LFTAAQSHTGDPMLVSQSTIESWDPATTGEMVGVMSVMPVAALGLGLGAPAFVDAGSALWWQILKWMGPACLDDGDCGNEVRSAYGGLSRAEEFGIRTYRELGKLTQGTGLQRHHIIEKRFAEAGTLNVNANDMLSVAVTPEEHQVFTNAWRALIGYSNSSNPLTTGTTSPSDILIAAQRIYRDFPELLRAAERTILGQ